MTRIKSIIILSGKKAVCKWPSSYLCNLWYIFQEANNEETQQTRNPLVTFSANCYCEGVEFTYWEVGCLIWDFL